MPISKFKNSRKNNFQRSDSNAILKKRRLRYKIFGLIKTLKYLLLAVFCGLIIWYFKYGGQEYIRQKVDLILHAIASDIGLNINSIELEGNKIISDEEIIDTIIYDEFGNEILPNMSFSLAKMEEKILQNKWVDKVYLKKKLPDKLLITIVEKKPFAILKNKEKEELIDEKGSSITSKIDNVYRDLLTVTGSYTEKDTKEIFSLIMSYDNLYHRIKQLDYIGNRRWNMLLNNDILLMLPEKNIRQSLDKILDKNYEENILNRDIKYIDLRIEDKIIIGR